MIAKGLVMNFEETVASVATRSGRTAESQAEPSTPAISGRDEGALASAPEQPPKKTVSALSPATSRQ